MGELVVAAVHGEGDVVAQHVEVPRQHALRVAVWYYYFMDLQAERHKLASHFDKIV